MKSRNPVFTRGFAYDELSSGVIVESTTDRPAMTVEGVLQRVGLMFAPLVAVGALAYLYAPPVLALPALFVAAGLGFWAAMSQKSRPGVMFAYAIVEGVVLGVFSAIFEARYPGIVTQAVVATLLTAGAVFALYRARIVRATARFKKIVLLAGIGYALFLLVNFAFAVFGAGGGVGIYATPIGLAVAAFGAVLASAFLVLDFDAIEEGVSRRAPAENEWRAAFGLVLTLVWLYLEMLRLISIIRR